MYRSWGIPCSGKQVYTPRHREQWLNKITQPGVRRRAELMYQQMDGLSVVRHSVRGELLAESQKHQAVKTLRQVPLIGPLRAALLLTLMQTPHRFRSKRQLWHRTSRVTICPLAQPNKAVGLESQIGPWLAQKPTSLLLVQLPEPKRLARGIHENVERNRRLAMACLDYTRRTASLSEIRLDARETFVLSRRVGRRLFS